MRTRHSERAIKFLREGENVDFRKETKEKGVNIRKGLC